MRWHTQQRRNGPSKPRRKRSTTILLPEFCVDLEEPRRVDHAGTRSEEHTSELQSHRDLPSFPTRRSSDLRNGPSKPRRKRSTTILLPEFCVDLEEPRRVDHAGT